MPGGVDEVDHPAHGVQVGHVGRVRRGGHSPPGEVREQVRGFRRTMAPAADQGQVAHTAFGQPAGAGGSESAQASGDEVGALGAEPGCGDGPFDRWGLVQGIEGDDDLPDVPGVLHQREGLRDAGGGVGAVGEGDAGAVVDRSGVVGPGMAQEFALGGGAGRGDDARAAQAGMAQNGEPDASRRAVDQDRLPGP